MSAATRGGAGDGARRSGFARDGGLALVDQGTVSATSFVTTVLIGRIAGPEALGAYSLAFSALVMVLAVQETLIALPYSIFGTNLVGRDRREYAGAVLVHGLVLAGGASAAVAMAATAMFARGGLSTLQGTLATLAAVLPFLLVRDLLRRYLFAHLRMAAAVGLDVVVMGLQLAGLAALAASGRLTGATALLAAGVSAAIAAGGGLLALQSEFAPRRASLVAALRRNWSFGRWGFASRMLGNVNSDIVMIWLVVAILGPEATGVFAACAAVVAFSNPFMVGVGNYLTPRIRRDFESADRHARRRVIGRVTLTMGAVMAGFCLVLAIVGGEVLNLLYGARYAGAEPVIVLLALAILATALGLGSANGLWALERPDLNFRASVVGMAVSVVAVPLLGLQWGLAGFAGGLLVGHAADSAVRAAMFLAMTREPPPAGSPVPRPAA